MIIELQMVGSEVDRRYKKKREKRLVLFDYEPLDSCRSDEDSLIE